MRLELARCAEAVRANAASASWPCASSIPECSASLIKGEVDAEVLKLKAQEGGEIQVHGSGNLIQTLLKLDLIDTLRLWQFPVAIGTGKRLFGEGTIPASFRLVDTQLTATGAVLHVYERAGNLAFGEMEVGQETVVFDSNAAGK